MRLATWNCYRGDCISRAAELDAWQPDLSVLQECARPTAAGPQCQWFGANPMQGLGVVARHPWTLSPAAVHHPPHHSVFPSAVMGPQPFHLLAVWAQKRPNYVRAILDGLDLYRDFLHASPSVVVGDFNSHPRWDLRHGALSHSALQHRLKREFGLVSAWHAFAARSSSPAEPATLYWLRRADQPFHIDYCFIPESWLPRLQSVRIGRYEDWHARSDHMPLLVDLAD